MKNKVEFLERVDWNVINTYVENKLIIVNKHPEYDIWILNYSKEAQFTKTWDAYTLSCRGLVIDAEGKILARPFQKFKNYEEHDPSEIDMSEDFEVFEKMDGSLGVLFYYNVKDEWILATRGSFISEQAVEAKKILIAMNGIFVLDRLSGSYTYLFEIIYPENRIVVDYGKTRNLVLLTRINTETGDETPYNNLVAICGNLFTIVKRYDVTSITNLTELRNIEGENREGFVVKFKNGFRVKIKYQEYCRLHSIITNVSNLSVWRHLKVDGDFAELLENVPDEFYKWLNDTVFKFRADYNAIELGAYKEFVRIYHTLGYNTRKEFALEALKSEHRGILFKIYEDRTYCELIWKQLRPVYSKPFKDGHDDAE